MGLIFADSCSYSVPTRRDERKGHCLSVLRQSEHWTVNVGGCFRLKTNVSCEAEKDGGTQQDNVKSIKKNLFFVANLTQVLNRHRKRGLKKSV